jgi:uncharacterized repeat protein (TIGR03803 family)
MRRSTESSTALLRCRTGKTLRRFDPRLGRQSLWHQWHHNLGGDHAFGTVFKLDATGNETVLYSFTGGADGAYPRSGLIRDSAGNLDGAASGGGALSEGTVFKVVLDEPTVEPAAVWRGRGAGHLKLAAPEDAGPPRTTRGFATGRADRGACSRRCHPIYSIFTQIALHMGLAPVI